MSWVRLDDQFPDHPKVAGLSNEAFCLHVTAMCWTAKQQTDGKLPSIVLRRLAWRCQDPATAATELEMAGVWDKTPEGWEIHDFLDYNPTKEQVAELAAKRSAAGTAGAMARWQTDSKPNGKSHGKQDSKPHGKIMPPSPSPVVESIVSSIQEESECVNGAPTYPSGFEAFETNFRLNLLNAVKERDPRQMMAGGFSLSDASKAMLLQVMTSGPVLSASAIEWALDQWEEAKPKENFRVQDKGCVNWLLTTISNSYKPTRKGGKNGTDPSPFPSPVKNGKLRMVYEDGTIEEVEAMTNG